jgi:PKD repeat protein
MVFLALPKGSTQPVMPYKTVTAYSTPVPSPSAAQQIYPSKPPTPKTTSPAVNGQVSGGALSTAEYSASSRAQFRANRTAGPAPLTISFYDLTLGSPGKWVWDFGDTSGSSERNPVHTYKSPGKYTVTMDTVISGTMYSNSMNITVTGN